MERRESLGSAPRRCFPIRSLPERSYALDKVIDNGWVLVATDYVGLGTAGPHPYLIGQGEARSVLDSVRAARELTDLLLAGQTVVWGHSQGGGAALWAGQIQPGYAPDVPLAGIAALAPASDLVGLATNLENVTGGGVFASYVLKAYSDTYPDVKVSDYVGATGRPAFDEAAKRCLGLSTLVSAITVGNMSIFTGDLDSGALNERLRDNIPTGPFPMPLLLAQGQADSLILPAVQSGYADSLCAAGQPVDYRTFPGLDHVPLVEADSPLIPQVVEWTQDRLAG